MHIFFSRSLKRQVNIERYRYYEEANDVPRWGKISSNLYVLAFKFPIRLGKGKRIYA